jgi:hypothetical protein
MKVTHGMLNVRTSIDVEGQEDQSGSDTCHPCSGDTWNIYTNDVSGPYNLYDTWQGMVI